MAKKLLWVLPANSLTSRVVRRAVIVGVLSLIAVLINEFTPYAPGVVIPLATAVGAALDKLIRELYNNKTE